MYVRQAIVVSIGIMAGCGTDDTPADDHTPADVSACAAVDAVVQLGKLATAMDAMDGTSGFGATQTLFDDATVMFHAGSRCSADFTPSVPTSASCTPAMCTFAFSYAMYPSIGSFDGTVIRDGHDVTLALDAYNGHSPALGAQWTIDGSLTLTGTTVSGTFHARAVVNGNFPAPGTYETTVDFNSVSVDTDGCPVGGSLQAVDIAKVTEGDLADSHDIAGSIAFGPACGGFQ